MHQSLNSASQPAINPISTPALPTPRKVAGSHIGEVAQPPFSSSVPRLRQNPLEGRGLSLTARWGTSGCTIGRPRSLASQVKPGGAFCGCSLGSVACPAAWSKAFSVTGAFLSYCKFFFCFLRCAGACSWLGSEGRREASAELRDRSTRYQRAGRFSLILLFFFTFLFRLLPFLTAGETASQRARDKA